MKDPVSVATNKQNTRLLVADAKSRSVHVFSLVTGKHKGTILQGAHPGVPFSIRRNDNRFLVLWKSEKYVLTFVECDM